MKIYDNAGWLDAPEIIIQPEPLQFIVGARGIGKTYGFIKYFVENRIPFIYMRRTQIETDLQGSEHTSSLKKIFNDLGIIPEYKSLGKGKLHSIDEIYQDPEGNEQRRHLCLCVPMSTIAAIRGFDFSDYDYGIYDEFITEPHVKAIRQEGNAVAGAYETINRNRELEGRPAFKMIFLANSLNIANDVFMQFDLIQPAEMLINDPDPDHMVFRRKNIMLIICKASSISARKADTALYSEVSEEYARMSIKNEFILNDFTYVQKQDLKQYKCVWRAGDLYMYRHKSDHTYYCSFTRGETKTKYSTAYADLIRLQREQLRFWMRYLDGKIRFDSYRAVALFEKYFSAK